MVALLDSLRALTKGGADVHVFFFDGLCGGSGRRDTQMAECIAEELSAEPDAVTFILTGNLHARADEPLWMGWHLRQRYPSIRTYNFASAGGSAWGCTGDCGPHALAEGDLGGTPRIVKFTERDEHGFDGIYFVGRATAAAPAARPALPAAAQPPLVPAGPPPERAAAERAYAAKDYMECARLYRLSSRQNSGDGAANDMYGAACCEALGGRSQEAMKTLGEAIEMGFSNRSHLESDPDLAALHSHPEWPSLLMRMPASCGR